MNGPIENDTWAQAALPVRNGGLGIRKMQDLSLIAYLSSWHASKSLVEQILPNGAKEEILDNETQALWTQLSNTAETPSSPDKQKSWDHIVVERTYKNLLDGSSNTAVRSCLLGVTSPYAGAWLEALPVASLGTRLDEESVRIAVSLRLGAPICLAHKCKCTAQVQNDGLHGLDCKKSAGRFARHAELNNIIHRSLTTIGHPSVLEPSGITRDDGRRPDGLTLFPWKNGKPLVWDVTCVATLAASNLIHSSRTPGAAATEAERKKSEKYSDLLPDYAFTPLGFETMGHWGSSTINFIRKLGVELSAATNEPRSSMFLRQRLSIAIQRGNAAAVRGTVPEGSQMGELFYLPFSQG